MLHQTLLTFRPFPSSSSSSSSSSPYTIISPPSAVLSSSSTIISKPAGRPQTCTPTYTVSSQVEMDVMKEMLSSAHEQGLLAEKVYGEGWGSERGNLLAEEFQVDDLLDLRGLPESEEEDEEIAEVAEASFSTDKPLTASPNEPLELYSEITLHETDADAASLEWLSRFFDESSTEFPSPPAPPCFSALPSLPIESKHSSAGSRNITPARSLSSTATAAGSLSTEALVPIKAKRSKRLRGNGAVWYRSGKLRRPDSSPASSSITTFTTASPSSSSSSSSSSFNSYITYEPSPFSGFILDDSNAAEPNVSKPKKRGRRPKNPLTFPGERRCTHCGVHKTPQWRAGPHGAKTLCNACGVRFKSGRLLPEYRPACSPTFVSHIHSNSHRKVLEMRRKKDEDLLITSAPPVTSC